MRRQTSDIRPTYRHFERSEKSLSFAVWRSMIGNSKRETCHRKPSGIAPFEPFEPVDPEHRSLKAGIRDE